MKEGEVRPVVYLMLLFLVDFTQRDKAFLEDFVLVATTTGDTQSVVKAKNFILVRKRDYHLVMGHGATLLYLRGPLMQTSGFYLENGGKMKLNYQQLGEPIAAELRNYRGDDGTIL